LITITLPCWSSPVSLTITKSVTGALDDECFLFTVTVTPANGSGSYTFKEVIEGSGSKVIKGLPKGTYSVSEDTAWSWHYNTTNISWADTYGNDQQLGETNADTTMICNVTNSSRTPVLAFRRYACGEQIRPLRRIIQTEEHDLCQRRY
jgi:hypothetical protein